MNKQQQSLSKYINSRLSKFGMKQLDVADCVGVSRSYISKLVNGKWYAPPSINFLNNLAKCFGDFPSEAIDAAGVYDKDALDAAISKNPNIAAKVRDLYQ